MGAAYKGNTGTDREGNLIDKGYTYSGYTFIPDGSGALYQLSRSVTRSTRVYGEDYALLADIAGYHTTPMRMPVFGQVQTVTAPDGSTESSGYLAIIEEGDTLASLEMNHSTQYYASVIPTFITRQRDTSKSNWTVYASRRYLDDYKLRYIILSDDDKARDAALGSYYECSWMGMAYAYRDYLDAQNNGFERLTSDDVATTIPLYIETFGCMDTVRKIMSIPVTVSVSLTSFEDIEKMYDYLIGENVTNVKFKMTGYANGGLKSEVPYKLKWESSVGGKSGFKDLLDYAADHPELGIFPDFDFVYTSGSGTSVNMKKYAARTVDNRYTSKRVYSVTQQTLISHFQMVLSPATFSHFYEKLESKYAKYENMAISLSTMGSDLNSSFDEEKSSLREDSKNYTIEALAYFSDKGYDIMVNGGNAYTWNYADYILDVPLDSNRYNNEYSAVPFMGVVLHGYVEFAGTALNMEGNLAYAMLKAMESGAGVYFIISYANTELLKEDELLSQNYSVRYDIWRSRLVEIYQELNSVLADVQTKLIIDHSFLNGTRVPDADELLQDALEEAEKEAAAVKERLENIELASNGVAQVATKFAAYKAQLAAQYAAVQAQRAAGSTLMTAWDAYKVDVSNAAAKAAFLNALTVCVAQPMAELRMMRASVDGLLAAAKDNYDYLVSANADAAIIATAAAQLAAIEADYALICTGYGVATEDLAYDHATERDLFLYGDAAYAAVSVDDLSALFALAIEGDGSNIAFDDIVAALAEKLEIKTVPVVEESASDNGTADKSYKYAIDNEIVLVTYGDVVNGQKVGYKSLILNFNDYAVTTEVDGVVYHVDAYDYVVIKHQNG